jgi:broad specificity phosphatase PhoE
MIPGKPRAARIHLIRHGRAAAGWDTDPDPGLDSVGRLQAAALAERLGARAPMPIVTSPFRRCQETAAVLAVRWRVAPVVEPLVGEIPSPPGVPIGERVAWLRQAMTRTWSELGDEYVAYRDAVVAYVSGLRADTVVTSHFVAINAVIGACIGDDRLVIRRLDNASVTVVDTSDGGLSLVAGGHEADTLIR